MSTLSRADGSQMAEERIMEEQQKGRSSKKTKKKKKGAVDPQSLFRWCLRLAGCLCWDYRCALSHLAVDCLTDRSVQSSCELKWLQVSAVLVFHHH